MSIFMRRMSTIPLQCVCLFSVFRGLWFDFLISCFCDQKRWLKQFQYIAMKWIFYSHWKLKYYLCIICKINFDREFGLLPLSFRLSHQCYTLVGNWLNNTIENYIQRWIIVTQCGRAYVQPLLVCIILIKNNDIFSVLNHQALWLNRYGCSVDCLVKANRLTQNHVTTTY